MRRYVARLGGVQVNVPIERTLKPERVAQEMQSSFDGRNAWELAQSLRVGLRQVQRILFENLVENL